MRDINFLYIHITDSYYGTGDIIDGWHVDPKEKDDGTWRYKGKNYSEFAALPKEVQGLEGNGWDHVGYHYAIGGPYPDWNSWASKKPDPDHDGHIYEMLPHSIPGYHVYGHNPDSLAIVIVAKSDHKTGRGVITGSQMRKVRRLAKGLVARYPGIEIRGHYEAGDPRKSYCPSINMHHLRSYIFSRGGQR